MKTICEQRLCTGCGLCASLCPTSSIMMKTGKLGHLFPIIDNEKCINCGLCTKKCPSINPIELSMSQHAYAAWSKDEYDYRSSTSGGASSVLSQFIIHQGGVVYGCAVLPGATIEHIRIEKKDELYKIKGSKYVQSSIIKILPFIKNDVKEKRAVLFIGTPCQVASVKRLFKHIPDNLFLVDLICHGTPSQQSLKSYLKRSVSLKAIDDIKFRSGKHYLISVFSNNHLVYTSPERNKDYYLNAFYEGYTLRDSCYQCRYATPQRGSDITIGDFWGLGKESSCEEIPEHKFGISLVLPNTTKGYKLFQRVSSEMNVYERPVAEAIRGNERLTHPVEKTKGARVYRFFQPFMGYRKAYVAAKELVGIYAFLRRVVNK